jgi:hypothetical protein
MMPKTKRYFDIRRATARFELPTLEAIDGCLVENSKSGALSD